MHKVWVLFFSLWEPELSNQNTFHHSQIREITIRTIQSSYSLCCMLTNVHDSPLLELINLQIKAEYVSID